MYVFVTGASTSCCPPPNKVSEGTMKRAPYVCVCVCASGLKINEKCYFSVISWPILILFVLSDRAWCGASKLLHRILKFINYANLCKFIQNQRKMLLLCHFLADFDSVCFYLIGLGAGFKILHRILKFINYANLCKFIQNQRKMLLLCHFLADFDSVCFIW